MQKWLNKKQQSVSEKFDKESKRTEYEEEFQTLVNETEATKSAVSRLLKDVPIFLHPNVSARTKAVVGTAFAKMRKTASERRYPHNNGELGTSVTKVAEEFQQPAGFGEGLRHVGDALQKINDAQLAMDDEVYLNVLGPLRDLQEHQIKLIAKEKKKMEGRRLDYDFKKRKVESGKGNYTPDDVKLAEEKFLSSQANVENSMMSLLNNDVEQIGQLKAFVQAYKTLASNMMEALNEAEEALDDTLEQAQSRPKFEPSSSSYQAASKRFDDDSDDDEDSYAPPAAASRSSSSSRVEDGPYAIATFDFDAENEGEVSFKEGMRIRLLSRLDENWLEGEVNGAVGMFPSTYVEVVQDLD